MLPQAGFSNLQHTFRSSLIWFTNLLNSIFIPSSLPRAAAQTGPMHAQLPYKKGWQCLLWAGLSVAPGSNILSRTFSPLQVQIQHFINQPHIRIPTALGFSHKFGVATPFYNIEMFNTHVKPFKSRKKVNDKQSATQTCAEQGDVQHCGYPRAGSI